MAGQQDQQRKHSFQLVKLRSDVEEMRKHLNEGGAGTAEPTMEMQELTSEVRDLHSKMAMMKGKIAQLTMEIHMDGESPDHRLPGSDDESDPSISQHGRIKNSSSSGRPIKDCDPGNQLAFWSRVQASMGNLDKLADQLLQEKRSQLVTSLVREARHLSSPLLNMSRNRYTKLRTSSSSSEPLLPFMIELNPQQSKRKM